MDMKVVPYIDMIEQGKVELNGVNMPVVDVKVIPGDFSEPSNLLFDWNVSEMTKRSIKFKLLF